MESNNDRSDDATEGGLTGRQHGFAIIWLLKDVDRLEGRVSDLQQLIGGIDARVRAETARLDAHESRIAILERGRRGKRL
ncbi:MAG TPA: hypothetical protein VK665_00890 [Candidatus Elarobacter sp.]|nr:hypothetical protein [Candidatus Elarobacter sp.]